MVRASVEAEKAGVRSVSLVASGFAHTARMLAKSLGVPDLAIAEYPGVVMTDSAKDLEKKIKEAGLIEQIIEGLEKPLRSTAVEADGEQPPVSA